MSGMARAALLVLLLGAAGAAAWVGRDLYTHATALQANQRDTADLLDRSMDAVHELVAAQRAYVAPAQPLRPWLDRVSALVQQLYRDTAALGRAARSPDTLPALDRFEAALSAFVDSDTRVRERLRLGELRAAADIVFDETPGQIDSARRQLQVIRRSEAAAAHERHTGILTQAAAAGAIALALAILGLLLARAPARAATPPGPGPDHPQPGFDPSAPESTPPANGMTAGTAVDLDGLADACVRLSRLASADGLSDTLARAAGALGASGLIVWLEHDGRLTPAAAHGYEQAAVARMGPIDRTATHATAMAWQTGRLHTVAADATPRAAIVAPMLGPAGCIGVVAAEVPAGGETEPSRTAAARLFAAQLAAAFAGRDEYR